MLALKLFRVLTHLKHNTVMNFSSSKLQVYSVDFRSPFCQESITQSSLIHFSMYNFTGIRNYDITFNCFIKCIYY